MKCSFVFYSSFYEAIKELPPDIQLEVYNSISEYALFGNEPNTSGTAKAIFFLIKPQIDANNQKYENGKKGGRPTQNNQSKTKQKPKHNQTITKAKPNDNVNVNVNVNDNVNDNVIKTICTEPKIVSMPEPINSIIFLPLNDKSEYPIMQNQVDEWTSLYPAVDIIQELRNMKGWCSGNPTKLKTRRGILKFINGWLAKEQNKGGGNRAAPSGESEATRRLRLIDLQIEQEAKDAAVRDGENIDSSFGAV